MVALSPYLILSRTASHGASSPPPPPPPPVWLPQAPSGDYPVAYADFKNGRYWYGGAEGTAAGFLSSTAAVVGGSGLHYADGVVVPSVVGVAATSVLAMFNAMTVVSVADAPVWSGGTDNIGPYGWIVRSASDNDELGVTHNSYQSADGRGTIYFYDNIGGSATLNGLKNIPQGGDLKIAATAFGGQFVMSQNGETNVTTAADLSNLVAEQVGVLYWDLGGTLSPGAFESYLQSVAFYAPQPDSDLPTLSTP